MGWWAFIIGYGLEWIVPALTWPFCFLKKKTPIPAIHAAWLLFLDSLTWWLINLGIAALWIVGALKYTENDVFSKKEIWILVGCFLGYAFPTNVVYFWVYHKDASHPQPDDDSVEGDSVVSIGPDLVSDVFDFDF